MAVFLFLQLLGEGSSDKGIAKCPSSGGRERSDLANGKWKESMFSIPSPSPYHCKLLLIARPLPPKEPSDSYTEQLTLWHKSLLHISWRKRTKDKKKLPVIYSWLCRDCAHSSTCARPWKRASGPSTFSDRQPCSQWKCPL